MLNRNIIYSIFLPLIQNLFCLMRWRIDSLRLKLLFILFMWLSVFCKVCYSTKSFLCFSIKRWKTSTLNTRLFWLMIIYMFSQRRWWYFWRLWVFPIWFMIWRSLYIVKIMIVFMCMMILIFWKRDETIWFADLFFIEGNLKLMMRIGHVF